WTRTGESAARRRTLTVQHYSPSSRACRSVGINDRCRAAIEYACPGRDTYRREGLGKDCPARRPRRTEARKRTATCWDIRITRTVEVLLIRIEKNLFATGYRRRLHFSCTSIVDAGVGSRNSE